MQYYGTRLSENISRREPEGYLLCLNVPVARTGTQEYLPEELGLPAGNGPPGLIPVIRPEEEVFSKETIIDYGPEWCKVTTGKLTGYMMTEYIEIDGEIVPGQDAIAPDPDQAEDEDDFIQADGSDEYEPGDMVQISLPYEACANAYPLLRALCEQIEDKVGRG